MTNNVYTVQETDGYETYGLKAFSSASKAHLYACERSRWEVSSYSSGCVIVRIFRDGENALNMQYHCGGYTDRWVPEDLPPAEE